MSVGDDLMMLDMIIEAIEKLASTVASEDYGTAEFGEAYRTFDMHKIWPQLSGTARHFARRGSPQAQRIVDAVHSALPHLAVEITP